MNFAVRRSALREVESKFAWQRAEVAGDRFPGLSGPFQALDFSDFLLLCRDDFPDDSLTSLRHCCARRRSFWKASIATFRRRTVR